MSWDLVKSKTLDLSGEIQKRHLGRRFQHPRLRGLEEIAIDEISLGKHGRFITLVLGPRRVGARCSPSAKARGPRP